MLQAMYNGVSAIEAHQQRMDVIGNNIANVNTTAYKAGSVTFQDQLSQEIAGPSKGDGVNLGGTNPQQIGLGVKVGSIGVLMSQGGLQSTSRPTDMAIQGNGYFMVGNGTNVSYTRDGSFAIDNQGNLVSAASGEYVLGWKANQQGIVNTTPQIDSSSKLSIPVGGLTSTSPTQTVTFGGNLSAQALSTDPAYSRSVKVYDSLGESQTLTIGFTRNATLPATPPPPAGAVSSWTWSASGPGIAAPTGTTNQGTIYYDNNGQELGSNGSISMTLTDGATSPQTITPNFTGTTMISGQSIAAPTGQDGFGPGTLQSFNIDPTGTITGIFNNGYTRTLGQVALTNFANPEGLERAGGNEFRATVNSGIPQVGTATSGSLGKISSGYLEQSNVDLSNEFTNMIVTQRGFQANTKIVSTVDQMLNDVIMMKQ